MLAVIDDRYQSIRDHALRAHRYGVRDMVTDLGAELFCHPGGRTHLGASDTAPDGTPIIVLNERIVATPLYVPVLAHELTHVIQHDGFRPCTSHYRAGVERIAWVGGSILAIPSDDVAAIVAGEACVEEIAVQCDVPLSFANLRASLESNDVRIFTDAYRRWLAWLTAACQSL